MATDVSSLIPGRDIHTYDLLGEMQEKYNLDRRATHESIHAFLSQVIEIDGEDAVVLSSRPIRPELLDSNPRDLDVHYWLTISGSAAETIREAFAATYATEKD